MLPTPSSSSASLAPTAAAAAQHGLPSGAATWPSDGGAAAQHQLAISNGVLLAAVIFLFMVVVFVFLLYLYAKRYLGTNPLLAPSTPSSRFLLVAASPLPQRGLPAAVLRSLPVTVYGAAGSPGKERLECAVCLSEVADGEKVRTLPKCAHGFHVECIDMWFHSHDTCPLCRAPVGADLGALPREDPAAAPLEFPVFPTNVLFWGTHDEVANAGPAASAQAALPPPIAGTSATSSSASGRRKENLVIDIPTRAVAINTPPMNSPLPASRMPGNADDMRSPVSARLRSLRRLLSRGKQAVVGTSYSPRAAAAGDIEQGLAGPEAARPPKTPKTPKTPPSAN
ncbi:E3 ubiquitin-protein ligase EL5-like [Panicum miliaceum]|uniref:RING-type E3 ubiquitin transferase n=1 Tax=Panicum miliaceum TaxID=4540 RepID=A0A3L6S364_PANMI|nr:E3 ubiquitin-protein ligase EL5-like [Panicum miliaceum]